MHSLAKKPAKKFAKRFAKGLRQSPKRTATKAVVASLIATVLMLAAASPASAAPNPADLIAMFLPETSKWLESIFNFLAECLSSSQTEANIQNPWFVSTFGLHVKLAVASMAVILMWSTGVAVLHGDLTELIRMYVIGIPTAVVGAIAAFGIAILLHGVVKDLDVFMYKLLEEDFKAWQAQMITAGTSGENLGIAFLTWIAVLLLAICTLIIAFEFDLRDVTIYVGMIALVWALMLWALGYTRNYLSTTVKVVVTAFAAKFIILFVLALGLKIMTVGIPNLVLNNTFGGIYSMLMGVTIMLLAALAWPVMVGFVLADSGNDFTAKQLAAESPASGAAVSNRRTIRGAVDAVRPSGRA